MEKSLHTLTLGSGQTHSYVIYFPSRNFILEIARSSGLAEIIFHLRLEGKIFGHKRDENGEWKRLHNEELHSLYRSPNIVRVNKSRRLRGVGHVARMEEGRSAFKILTGKPTVKRPFGEA